MLQNLVNHLNLETSQPRARARAHSPQPEPTARARLPLFFRSNPYLTRTFWRNPYLTRPSSHKILENRPNPYLTRTFWRNPYLTRPSSHKIIINSINPCLTRTFWRNPYLTRPLQVLRSFRAAFHTALYKQENYTLYVNDSKFTETDRSPPLSHLRLLTNFAQHESPNHRPLS